MKFKERPAENLLGRIVILLVVKPVLAAEVGDAALGGNARAAEEDYIRAFLNQCPEFQNLGVYLCHFLSTAFLIV